MITSEPVLLDTNILVYAADKLSPFHETSAAIRERGLKGEIRMCLCPQVLSEFFAIVTDPNRVKNPRRPKEALLEIEKYWYSERIVKIYPGPAAVENTFDLLRRYDVKKQEIFDLQLVATMLSNNVTRLYTFNREDFSRFKEIEVITPR